MLVPPPHKAQKVHLRKDAARDEWAVNAFEGANKDCDALFFKGVEGLGIMIALEAKGESAVHGPK